MQPPSMKSGLNHFPNLLYNLRLPNINLDENSENDEKSEMFLKMSVLKCPKKEENLEK